MDFAMLFHFTMRISLITRKAALLICMLYATTMNMIAQTYTESVTFDFSPSTAVYGMTFVGSQEDIEDTDIKIQDVTLSLQNTITYFNAQANSYIRLSGNPTIGKKKGSLKFCVPTGCSITKITFTASSSNGGIDKLQGNTKNLSCDKGKTCNINLTSQTNSITFTEEGVSSYITKIAVAYTRNKPDAAFDEKDANTEQTIKDNIGKTSATITRAFNNNYMNSLCVPFNLTCEKVKEVFGENTIIYRYTGSTDGSIYLSSTSDDDIPAGMPVIIKPGIYVDTPVFTDISISENKPQEILYSDIALCGTYAPYAMNTDGSEVFLNTSQTFSKPKAGGNTMRGFRCYFRKNDNGVKDLSAIFDYTDATNGIEKPQSSHAINNGTTYSIGGDQTGKSLQRLAQGIYIANGKKILITK